MYIVMILFGQVSPLKSLLREDLKRRITARANSRPNRHHSSSSNNTITVTTDGSSASTVATGQSNVPSVMAAAVAAATAAASSSNPTNNNNGAITSTETDMMSGATSSSSRKQRMLQCLFCGIEFPDQTLYFLHKGCHSESNPWKCNICGEQLGNVYEFNSHLLSKSHQ